MSTAFSFETTPTPPWPIHRFTVEQYHRLGELGILTPDDRVELIEGWIVEKMNHRPIHGYVVRWLNDWFQRELPKGWLCQCQLPITTEHSEPEPDIAIIYGQHSDFLDRHPYGTDCRLIVEVADTSLQKDRAKAAIYCKAGVTEYWIVNLVDNRLERYEFLQSKKSVEPSIFASNEIIFTNIGGILLGLTFNQLFAS